MKIPLTPHIAYIIGLWKHRRTKEGIGVEGSREACQVFASELVANGMAKPEEIRVEEGKVFTYHSAYRAFFDEVLKDEGGRFRYKNDFSANFFAGMFDSVGGEKEGKTYFAFADNADEMALLRLNWRAIRTGKTLWVGPSDEFKAWMQPFRKIEVEAKTANATKRSSGRKIERRPNRVYPKPPA